MSRYLLVLSVALELFRARILLAVTARQKTLSLVAASSEAVSIDALSPADLEWLGTLRWAILGLAARMPFRSDCIVCVIAGQRILKRRGLAGKTEIQVGRRPDGSFEAHIWLECAGVFLTGGPNDAFTTLPAGLSVPREGRNG